MKKAATRPTTARKLAELATAPACKGGVVLLEEEPPRAEVVLLPGLDLVALLPPAT